MCLQHLMYIRLLVQFSWLANVPYVCSVIYSNAPCIH